jgi:Cu(I)/Ag(I) efflux system membrane fusion protein
MNANKLVVALAAAGLAAAGGYGLYRLGMNAGMTMGAAPAAAAKAADPGRKVLYWHDPMVPGHKFDKPGKSPFMDMELVPVYADEASDQGGVAISSRVQQNLGIRTAIAALGEVTPRVEAVGTVAWNERDVTLVQARANGFVGAPRWTRSARASPSPTSTCPSGWPRRRSTSPPAASRLPGSTRCARAPCSACASPA